MRPIPKSDKQPPGRPPRARPVSMQPARPPSVAEPTSPASAPRVGLAASPTDAVPVAAARPKPPGARSKRASWAPGSTGATSPRMTPSPRMQQLEVKDRQHDTGSSGGSGRSSPERFTGTVAERTEDELARASREALQDALRKEWLDRDKRAHEARIKELELGSDALQDKYDAAFQDQTSLESELEAVNDLVDRLRGNLAEAERQVRQGQRRYADQEKAFEAERLVFQADQQQLLSRLKSLTTERITSPSGDRNDVTDALQEELVTLTASHQTLVAQLTTLSDEMHEVKSENARLQEENDSWQLLIEERTLAGHMRGGLIGGDDTPSREGTPSSIQRKDPSAQDSLEDQMEMDELHSELDAQQPIFDESDRAMLNRKSRGGYVDLGSPSRPNGSLAAEMGMSADLEGLRNEIKTLKEANKALSLYCSKIIDGIISQDGMEHVLSLDYRTRRGTRRANGAVKRPTASELAQSMETKTVTAEPEEAPRSRPTSYIQPKPVPAIGVAPGAAPGAKMDDKRARRGFSIDFRSLRFGAPEKPEAKPVLKPLQLASRATSASPPKATSSPIVAMTPQLPAPAPAPVTITPPAPVPTANDMPPPPVPQAAKPSPVTGARKLDQEEEDEEDRRERSRMEATLKLMGIDKEREAAEGAAPQPTSSVGSWLTRRLSRASTTSRPVSTQSQELCPSPRPVSQLSLTSLPDRAGPTPTPETEAVAAALKAYDAREKEQAKLLAQGKQGDSYTAPPKLSVRRNRTSGSSVASGSGSAGSRASVVSVGSAAGSGAAGSNGVGDIVMAAMGAQGHRKARESVSTLWSIGSNHD